MNRKIIVALGAVLFLALGGVAEARNIGGMGGGGGGGHSFGGGSFGGGNIARSAPSFSAPSFKGSGFARSHPSFHPSFPRRGPIVGFKGDFKSGHHHHHHRHFRRGVVIGLPFYGYYYDNYYYDDCGWLYRRAMRTGSPYWWRRYEECIGY